MKMHYVYGFMVGFFTITSFHSTTADEESLSELNSPCHRREDCPEFGYWCNGNMTCQCNGLYIPNKSRTKCVGGVGQKCSYDDNCIEKAYCEKQTICKCKKKYHPTDDGLVCVKNSSGHLEYSKLLKFLVIIFAFVKIS